MNILREVITQETTLRIIKENLDFYYKADERLSSWLAKRILVVFGPYMDLDLRVSLQTGKLVYESKLMEYLPEFLMNLRVERQKFKDTFLGEDGTSGVVSTTNNSKLSYSGFNTTNQDGDFERTSNTSITKGSQTLNFMMYLEAPFKKWSVAFKDDVLDSIIKLIY